MNLTIDKCTHPNLRSFVFSDGKTEIVMCPAMLDVHDEKTGKLMWREACTEGDQHRRDVLAPARLFSKKPKQWK
jgi:hypothetical protein